MIKGLVSILETDHSVRAFDHHSLMRTKSASDVILDFLVYARSMMIYENGDRLHRRLMAQTMHDFLCDVQRSGHIFDVSMCVFDDYTFRDTPPFGARVIYTGRNCIGDQGLTTHYDFQFKGQLLPVWAKQQIRDGLCMVSFKQGLLVHQTNLIFHLI